LLAPGYWLFTNDQAPGAQRALGAVLDKTTLSDLIRQVDAAK
jgi:hypothetical protein